MTSSKVILVVLAAVTVLCVIPHRLLDRPGGDATLDMAVWGMPFEDRLFRDRYARGFEAMHDDVRVDYGRYQDLTDKYFAWHLLGQGADVMRVRITDYHAFVERGLLAPLDRFMDDPVIGLSTAERRDYTPVIWDLLEVDGRRYALPADHAQYGLYYNKAVFDAYDAAHRGDPLGHPHAGWTWEDLARAADRLAVPDGRGGWSRYGIDFDLWSWPFMAFFAQAGGELWDEAGTTTLIDSPAGVEALDFIVELLPHSASMRAVSQVGSTSGPDKLFAGGQAAMILDGSWRAPDLERVSPGLDFAIAPLPRHRRGAVVSGSVLWAVSAHSRHKELAWRMIRWMTAPEQALQYWDLLRVAPPARLSVVHGEGFRSTPGLIGADGAVQVHPMPPERFDDRAAWLLHGVTEDPRTGVMRAFVPVARHQKDLEDAIDAMLKRAVSPSRTETTGELLAAAARLVHRIIDRDRQARGLPPVER